MSVSAPPERNYGNEMAGNLKAQVKLAPQLYEAEAKYQPLYGELARRNFSDSLFGVKGGAPGLLELYTDKIAPTMSRAGTAAARASREADVADIEAYGGRVVDAIRGANPGQKRLLDLLTSQAGDELELGAQLDPSMAREVSQGVRSAQAARGLGFGGNDATMEVIARAMKAQDLRERRRGFAMGVAGLNQQTGIDPMLAVTGRPGMTAAPGAFGAPGRAGPGLFNPESGYAMDLRNTNYNADAAARIAESNANAGLYGAAISAAGQVASSM